MRRLLLLALLTSITAIGCSSLNGPSANRNKNRNIAPGDPLLSSDIEEQLKSGRSRYSYIEDDRGIAPPGYTGRSSPSGR